MFRMKVSKMTYFAALHYGIRISPDGGYWLVLSSAGQIYYEGGLIAVDSFASVCAQLFRAGWFRPFMFLSIL
jgi:hypothetical protein